jgi:hypothetical protein
MRRRHLRLSHLLFLVALSLVLASPTGVAHAMVFPPPPHAAVPLVLTNPCPGLSPAPSFYGVSPLSITSVPGMCETISKLGNGIWGYGGLSVWQAAGHSYVVLSGLYRRLFHLFNVDDPYHPQLLASPAFPPGGYISSAVFAFHQGINYYVSVTMLDDGNPNDQGCGWFVYNVNNPADPVYVTQKHGTDWCNVHEVFVSTDANGDADYAWLTMFKESGSGGKVVVLDIHDLSNVVETGRYTRPDDVSAAHTTNVVGNRVYLSYWGGGLLIFDKNTLAHSVNPAPLNPIDSIRPALPGGQAFDVSHAVPTTDGKHVFIEQEDIAGANVEKVKVYNIANVAAPYYETGIVGDAVAANNLAHNMVIQNQSPGHDLLYEGWYQAGTRGFAVDTSGATPVVTEILAHQVLQAPSGTYGDAWGVAYLPCMLHNQPYTCLYTADMNFGLVADAVGYQASLDPYPPDAQITAPTNGQTITACAVSIQGTADDYYSGLAQVEVSTDDGASWHAAQGLGSWAYHWTIPADGSYTLKVRAHDLAGNVGGATTSVSVTVSGDCGGPPCRAVVWTNLVNASVTGDALQKTSTVQAWDAGASGNRSFAAGNISVQVTVDSTIRGRMIGLTHNETGPSYTDISYAIELQSGGTIDIYELGQWRASPGTYAVGDVLKVAIQNGVVQYYRNGTLLYTSRAAPTYPLTADAALRDPQAQLTNAIACG